MSTWTDDDSAALRLVLTNSSPLGPLDADVLAGPAVTSAVYDPDNRIHRAIDAGAPFVVGRKGAGKTAFVNAPILDPSIDVVRLPKADVYQSVFDLIRRLSDRNSTVLVEHSEKLWSSLVWSAVLWKLAKTSEHRETAQTIVDDFVLGIGEDRIVVDEEAMIAKFVKRLSVLVDDNRSIGGLGHLLNSMKANGIELPDAIDAGRELLRARARRIVVIMDSLERYPADLPVMSYDSPEKTAFEGLFRFIGQHGGRTERTFSLRFAFPAELWHLLKEASSNHAKDFDRRVVAHWSARELITMAGNRLAAFMYINGYRHVEPFDFQPGHSHLGYDDSLKVLLSVLPVETRNGLGGPESTIGYLLRHTQLLPRHLILLLNEVLSSHLADSGDMVATATIVNGVRHAEERIKSDILSAYARVHPEAGHICERMIPNLPLVFTSGEAHRQYVQTGVRKATHGLEFSEALRSLVEVGAVGRVIDNSQSRYVIGEFEYTRPGQLSLGADERLCLHPIFAETYSSPQSSRRAAKGAAIRPIYPYGADPETTNDYRDNEII